MPSPFISSTEDKPHSPAQSYSLRVPSPPHVMVPPPALNANGIPDLHLVQDANYDFESSGFTNVEFLKTVTYGNLICSNNMLEWKFEQRRTAQKILPFLYLGPSGAAKDKDFLERAGISMVMAVRNTSSAEAKLLGTNKAQQLGIEGKTIDVAGNQELIAAFPRAIEAINTHLSAMYNRVQMGGSPLSFSQGQSQATPGKVLVFCETGNDRSASVVVAYIMAMYSIELVKAAQIVQAQRFAASFDDSLRNLLSTYDSILKAKRDVVHAKNSVTTNVKGYKTGANTESPQVRVKASKRTLDDAYDDSNIYMDMEGNEFIGSERREGIAPFLDKKS